MLSPLLETLGVLAVLASLAINLRALFDRHQSPREPRQQRDDCRVPHCLARLCKPGQQLHECVRFVFRRPPG